MRVVTADPLDREILDRAQELGLGGERQIGHFIQEQRAGIGRLELAAPAADPGGGPVLDAEQLRLEQRFHERGAVDGDERTVPAAAQLVDLPGHELLAYARFAFEQHGEIRSRDALDRRSQRLHDGRRSDQRRRAVASRTLLIEQPGACQLQARSLDLEDERPQLRGDPEHLKIPLAKAASGIEGRLEQPDRGGVGAGDLERHRLGARRGFGTTAPSAAGLAQLHRANGHDPPQRLLEDAAHQGNIVTPIERSRQRGQHLGDRLPAIALARERGNHGGG